MMKRLFHAFALLPLILGTAACATQTANPETAAAADPPAPAIAQLPDDADPACGC